MTGPDRQHSRRRVLAALGATATAGTAGCLSDLRAVLDRTPRQQVSLRILTVPAEDDPPAMTIARYLADRLERVGIAPEVVPMDSSAFLRSVLINYDFDLYVARFPAGVALPPDPDFLRPFLHSRFTESVGWQNPFGFADPSVDDLLERQRRLDGVARTRVLYDLQEAIAERRPFSVVAFPDAIRAFRRGRLETGLEQGLEESLDYLSLGSAGDGDTVVRLARTDARITRNLNPLSVEYRNHGAITGLLYDSIGRRTGNGVAPWLAERWGWSRPGDESGPVATVWLRPDLTWHDGRSLTAGDVAFTYDLLRDSSLGEASSPLPAPAHHRFASVVESVDATAGNRVRFRFEQCTTDVAARAFTVPILPEHVWRPLARPADVAGLETGRDVTEALLWANTDPVGSGPLRVEQVLEDTELRLARFDDHFLSRGGGFNRFAIEDAPSFDRLVFRVVPADETAVALVDAGEVDATDSSVDPTNVADIGRSDVLELAVERTREFYHVGFNSRRSPLGNYQFRRAVSSLLDEAHLVAEALNGYGEPAVTPLAATRHASPALTWNESDPSLPFPGTDGELDVERARQQFRRAGYRYAEDGRLLSKS